MSPLRCLAALAASAGLTIVALTAPVAAAPAPTQPAPAGPSIQSQIDEQLKRVPGGRQVGPNTIVWDKRGVTERFGIQQACQYEFTCIYADANYGGSQLDFWRTPCEIIPLRQYAWHNRVSSIQHNQRAGRVARMWYHPNDDPRQGRSVIWSYAAYHATAYVGDGSNDIIDELRPC